MILRILLLLGMVLPNLAHGQLLRPFRSYSVPNRVFSQVCSNCDVVTNTATPQQLSTPEGVEEVSTAVADAPHTRALVSGSCGSGTICGADSGGAFVVSNAHVWGTQIGKQVTIDIVASGQTKRLTGRVVFAGYSNSRMVDFSIAYFEGLSSKRYMPMLKTEPTGQPFSTTGSPRCVWPLVTKPFNDLRNYGDGLITGTPDAIGGQSGSAIYNSTGQQIALLTWSINGRCAGQKTSKLWQVATQRDVSLADLRPEGLKELSEIKDKVVCEEGIFGELPQCFVGDARPICEEGIFGELKGITAVVETSGNDPEIAKVVGPMVRPLTENVIASQLNTAMADMPIWYDPSTPPTDPPTDPPSDCYKLTDKEWALIQFIRSQENEAGFGDLLKGIDWVKLAKTIIEIIKLFQSEMGASEVAFGDFLKGIDWTEFAKMIIQIIKLFKTMEAPGLNDVSFNTNN